MGLLSSSLLQVNNLRDIENDRRHGKWTMAAIIGRRAALVELVTCDTLAYVIVLASVLLEGTPVAVNLGAGYATASDRSGAAGFRGPTLRPTTARWPARGNCNSSSDSH